jgi:hypothetical protein
MLDVIVRMLAVLAKFRSHPIVTRVGEPRFSQLGSKLTHERSDHDQGLDHYGIMEACNMLCPGPGAWIAVSVCQGRGQTE